MTPRQAGGPRQWRAVIRRVLIPMGACACLAGSPRLAIAQAPKVLVVWTPPVDGERFTMPPTNGERSAHDDRFPSQADQDLFFDHLGDFFQKRYGERLSPRLSVTDIRGGTLVNADLADRVLGQRLLLRQLSDYLDANGGIQIVVSFFDWPEYLGVLDGLKTDNGHDVEGPDLVAAPSTWIAHLAAFNVLLPDPVSRQDERFFRTQLIDDCRFDSHLYAVPWIVDVRLFFYWKRRFPSGTGFGDRVQFEHALVASREYQLASLQDPVPTFAIPVAADWDLFHFFSLLYWNAGGEWQTGGTAINEAKATDVVEFLKRLRSVDGAFFQQTSRGVVDDAFLRSHVASVIDGPWLLLALRSQLGDHWADQVGVSLPPFNVGSQRATFAGGLHLAAARRTNPLAALAVLRYLSRDSLRTARLLAIDNPESQPIIAAVAHPLLSGSPLETVVDDALQAGRTYPRVPAWPDKVEAQASRYQLFELFKHVATLAPTSVTDADLRLLRQQLDDALNPSWTPVEKVSVAALFLFLAAGVVFEYVRGRKSTERQTAAARTSKALDGAATALKDNEATIRGLTNQIEILRERVAKSDDEWRRIQGMVGVLTNARDAAIRECGIREEQVRVYERLLPSQQIQGALGPAQSSGELSPLSGRGGQSAAGQDSAEPIASDRAIESGTFDLKSVLDQAQVAAPREERHDSA